jgi:hypothetical protein
LRCASAQNWPRGTSAGIAGQIVRREVTTQRSVSGVGIAIKFNLLNKEMLKGLGRLVTITSPK